MPESEVLARVQIDIRAGKPNHRPSPMRFPYRHVAALSLALVSLAACGDDDTPLPPDAGPADLGQPDLGPPPSTLFGPCVVDSQCPGVGAVCRRASTGYTGGTCTVPCVDRTQCDDGITYHHCLREVDATESFCEQKCLNGIDCGRTNYTCEGEFPPAGGRCIGLCTTDEECGEGAECNVLSSRCVEPGTVPTTGSSYGESCTENADCRTGICLEQASAAGAPTGNNGGYCIAYCVLPPGYNGNDLYAGDTLPTGTCTGDAVCFPAINTQADGDLGACFDGCVADSDCRADEGYFCFRTFPLASGDTKTFMNGICYPVIDCDTAGCPTGYTCTVVGTRSVCAPAP